MSGQRCQRCDKRVSRDNLYEQVLGWRRPGQQKLHLIQPTGGQRCASCMDDFLRDTLHKSAEYAGYEQPSMFGGRHGQ